MIGSAVGSGARSAAVHGLARASLLASAMVAWAALGGGCTERLVLPLPAGSSDDGGLASGTGGARDDGGFPGDRLPPPPDGGSFCVVELDFTQQRGDVMLVVGRNYSMGTHFGDPTRIMAVQDVLGGLGGLIDQHHNAVRFGYQEFPGSDPACVGGGGCCAARSNVPPSSLGYMAVENALLACDTPGCVAGATARPIADALEDVGLLYQNLNDGAVDRYALLITDGPPFCGSPDPTCGGVGNALSYLSSLGSGSGVMTYVVAVGDDAVTDQCLSAIAAQGGTGSPFSARDRDSLQSALETIIAPIAAHACEITLNSFPPNQDKVQLFVDGQEVPRDPRGQEGWNFHSGSRNVKIDVFGCWCDRVQDGTSRDIQVISGCSPTIATTHDGCR